MWSKVIKRCEDSILRLTCICSVYNPSRPYCSPQDKKMTGTGFIIDINKGYVITNAHVIENAIEIVASTYSTKNNTLELYVVSYSPERDIALCQLTPESIEILKRFGSSGLEMEDSLNVKEGDEVLSIAFPSGEANIKATSGIVSGFTGMGPRYLEDVIRRDPTFIQITAALNPGTSGGPLMNSQGRVIGITSGANEQLNSAGLAIPSRSLTTILKSLISNTGKVLIPNFGIRWNPMSETMMRERTGDEKLQGIMVNSLSQDSFFRNHIERGDIITHINFGDMLTANFNNDGFITLCKKETSGAYCRKINIRKLTLSEFANIIELNSDIEVFYNRENISLSAKVSYMHIANNRIQYDFFNFVPPKYLFFAGMVVTELTAKLQEEFSYFGSNDNSVVIVQIALSSTIGKMDIFKPGNTISYVNQKRISTVQDIQDTINDYSDIEIATGGGSYVIINTEQAKQETEKFKTMYNIK